MAHFKGSLSLGIACIPENTVSSLRTQSCSYQVVHLMLTCSTGPLNAKKMPERKGYNGRGEPASAIGV